MIGIVAPVADILRRQVNGASILTVSSRALLDACDELGLDTAAMLAVAGLERARVYEADARISGEQVTTLWREAYARSQDPYLALHVVERLPFGAYRVIDFMARNSSTIGEGFGKIARYFPIINNRVDLAIEAGEDVVSFVLVPRRDTGPIPAAYAEYTLAACFLRMQLAVEEKFPLHAVEFVHPRPRDDAEYRRVFACDVHFSRQRARLVLERAIWDRSVSTRDSTLCEVLEEHANVLLEHVPSGPAWIRELHEAMQQQLRGGDPSIDVVARKLGMSSRSLQRRLKMEGIVYATLLDGMRAAAAKVYLGQGDVSIAEASHLLGFAEQSSFTRAFKRWTGYTPREFRVQAR